MRSMQLLVFIGLLPAGAMIGGGTSAGQDGPAPAVLYGEGVHAYFSGNSARAEQRLSDALQRDSQDPRTYYFRALALMRLGRTAEARGDMMVGAALEAQRPNRFAIGQALERVQGYDRLQLEQFRRQARTDAATSGGSTASQPPISPRESGMLRERVVIPLDEYLRPGVPQGAAPLSTVPAPPRTFAPAAPAIPAATPDDPFRDDPRPPAATPPMPPQQPAESESTEAPAVESEATPGETPPAVEAENPFGDL